MTTSHRSGLGSMACAAAIVGALSIPAAAIIVPGCWVPGASILFCPVPPARPCPPPPGEGGSGYLCSDLRPGAPIYTASVKDDMKCGTSGKTGTQAGATYSCATTVRACTNPGGYIYNPATGCWDGATTSFNGTDQVVNPLSSTCDAPPCDPEPPQ